MKPRKVRNYLRLGEKAACALGAAMSAVEAELGGKCRMRKLRALFPELQHKVVHPQSGHWVPLEKVIVWLNDVSGQPREEIADWLCRLDECLHDVSGPVIKLDARLVVVA
jgi:hypothetical protein